MNEEKLSIEITADEVIAIQKSEYDELRRKANVLDILEADIRMKSDEGKEDYSLVDDDLVMLLTGMKAYQMEKRRVEAKRNAARLKAQTGKDEADE